MLIEITYNVTDVYMSTTETPVYVEISFEQPGGSAAVWGSITGTLSNQTDLQNALNAKLDESTIDGGTEGQILSKASATDFDFAWINNYAKYLATNVRNQTGSTIGAFQVVYISGATGNKPLISLADADTEATSSKTYGVTATAIANNGIGDVVTAGELTGIDTSAFNEGDLLWLSTTAGGVVTSPPAEPAHSVFIGYVVRSHPTLGVIDVAIANGYELNELHGVQIATPTNNQGLFYNSSNSLWENKSIATVLGYTPEQPLTFNSPLSRAGNVVSIPQATGSVNGFLSATDWTTFNSKQAALGFTPANAATTLTINGVTFDLSTSRTWNISTGISGSGAAGQVTYWTGASAVSGSNNLFWDNTNGRLGIGTNVPEQRLHVLATAISTAIFSHSGTDGGIDVRRTSALETGRTSQIRLTNGTTFFGASDRSYQIINIARSATTTDLQFQYWDGTNYLDRFRLFSSGNFGINTGTTDSGQRLQVIGDTLLRGSGATSATTALTVQNSASATMMSISNDAANTILNITGSNYSIFQANQTTANRSAYFGSLGTGVEFGVGTSIATYTFLNGGGYGLLRINTAPIPTAGGNVVDLPVINTPFQPTSGTATFTLLHMRPNINQTGGANGVTRGLYVNPILTAAADWRSIEWSNNSGWGLYGAGTANNYLGGNVAIGSTSNTTDWLNIAASTTAKAHIYLAAGVAPTSPANGDIWFDGTDIKMRIGGVTKTFTLI